MDVFLFQYHTVFYLIFVICVMFVHKAEGGAFFLLFENGAIIN